METVTKMRLSKETLAILKNFSAINSNIVIKPGNKLSTISHHSNVYAEAKVDEEFETEIAIWDLNQFLGVISMFANPDLEFNEKYVDVSNGKSSIRYNYSNIALLKYPSKEPKIPEPFFSFELSDSCLNEIVKAANILQVNNLQMIGKNGTLSIIVDDVKNDSSNSFSLLIDENYDGPDYFGTFDVSDIKLLPGSYTVYLTNSIITRFVHENGNLSYIIATKKG